MYYYGDGIGSYGGEISQRERKYTIVQSLWTKPIKDKTKLKHILTIAALSLAYAHRSGYKVHMHTDSYGTKLLRGYGYEGLYTTLDAIPQSVPTELFAAGKFFAMEAEGGVGKVHTDLDVFLKKPVLDVFYENKGIDLICQQEEPDEWSKHVSKRCNMFIMGYPTATRLAWKGSLNTGIVGFNNKALWNLYLENYREALQMYTQQKFDQYRKCNIVGQNGLEFDFILEQITLSYISLGHNVHTLIPSDLSTMNKVADSIGYQHLQGGNKWEPSRIMKLRTILANIDNGLYMASQSAVARVK